MPVGPTVSTSMPLDLKVVTAARDALGLGEARILAHGVMV